MRTGLIVLVFVATHAGGCGGGSELDSDDRGVNPPKPFEVPSASVSAQPDGGTDDVATDEIHDSRNPGFSIGKPAIGFRSDAGGEPGVDTSSDEASTGSVDSGVSNDTVSSSMVCVPGSTQACLGDGQCHGVQSCSDNGRKWDQCHCPAAPPTPDDTTTDGSVDEYPWDVDSLPKDPVYGCAQGLYACTCIDGEECLQPGVECDRDGWCISYFQTPGTDQLLPRGAPPGAFSGVCEVDNDCADDLLCLDGVCGYCDPEEDWHYGVCECDSVNEQTGEISQTTYDTKDCQLRVDGATWWLCEDGCTMRY